MSPFLFLILSIGFAAYGFFTNKNSFIHLAIMFLMMFAWPMISALIPNVFQSGIGQWMFQFIIFMAVMSFIRSRMQR